MEKLETRFLLWVQRGPILDLGEMQAEEWVAMIESKMVESNEWIQKESNQEFIQSKIVKSQYLSPWITGG